MVFRKAFKKRAESAKKLVNQSISVAMQQILAEPANAELQAQATSRDAIERLRGNGQSRPRVTETHLKQYRTPAHTVR